MEARWFYSILTPPSVCPNSIWFYESFFHQQSVVNSSIIHSDFKLTVLRPARRLTVASIVSSLILKYLMLAHQSLLCHKEKKLSST